MPQHPTTGQHDHAPEAQQRRRPTERAQRLSEQHRREDGDLHDLGLRIHRADGEATGVERADQQDRRHDLRQPPPAISGQNRAGGVGSRWPVSGDDAQRERNRRAPDVADEPRAADREQRSQPLLHRRSPGLKDRRGDRHRHPHGIPTWHPHGIYIVVSIFRI